MREIIAVYLLGVAIGGWAFSGCQADAHCKAVAGQIMHRIDQGRIVCQTVVDVK